MRTCAVPHGLSSAVEVLRSGVCKKDRERGKQAEERGSKREKRGVGGVTLRTPTKTVRGEGMADGRHS